jgi:hypothetical protein
LGPDAAVTLNYPEIAPAVLEIIKGGHRPTSIEAGQLWLAGTSDRMLLWVEAVNHDARMATVLAATLDVNAADHTSLIVAVPELDRDVAIFTSVPGWIPIDALDDFVATADVGAEIAGLTESLEQRIELPDLDSVSVASPAAAKPRKKRTAKLRVGPRISGGSDERLDFRQMLADQLADLYPEDEGGGELDDERPGDLWQFDSIIAEMRQVLSEDLSSSRGDLCEVRVLDDFLVGPYATSLPIRPVATVHELDSVMLVVATESQHEGFGFQPEDAYKLLLDWDAASLAVAEPVQPYRTRMFIRSGLRPAFELPRAIERADPRPLWESRPLIQAVLDYLQGDVFPIESGEIVTVAPTHPDLIAFLPNQSLTAIFELKRIGAQKGKLRALKALSVADATALHEALATCADFDELLTRIEDITVQ